MKKPTRFTLFRFLIVGLCNTIAGCGLMFLLYHFAGCSYWFSSAANYVSGSILSFFLNKRFTFHNQERFGKPAVRFLLTTSACYLIAYGAARTAVFALLDGYDPVWQDNAAMIVGMGLYTVLNYLGQRFFVFR